MYTPTIYKKIEALSNEQLIKLSNELRQTLVPDNALVREVIKDTELDTSLPLLAFVGVGQILAHVLAERLESALADLDLYDRNGYGIRELREIDEERNR